jgi:hypothetical protein
MTVGQVKLFTLSVVAPSELRTRITEEYCVERQMLRKLVTVEGAVPLAVVAGSKNIPLPLVVAILDREEIASDLTVTDRDSKILRVLGHEECVVAVVTVLRTLIPIAYESTGRNAPSDKETWELIDSAMNQIEYGTNADKARGGAEELFLKLNRGDGAPPNWN